MSDTIFSKRLAFLFALLGLGVLLLFSTFGKDPDYHAAALQSLPSPTPPPSVSPSPLPLPPAPSISAESYLVQIIGEQIPLLKKDISKQMRPASLTKILTSLLAIEELDQNAPVIFSLFAKQAGEKESLVPAGEAFARNDAIGFAMVESANDAAVALAEAVGKKLGAFSFDDAMSLFQKQANQKAAILGMMDSRFVNPTGFDNTRHVTTAEDLFYLVSYIWEHHREIWDLSQASEVNITSLSGRKYHAVATNQLLKEFPALLGGKTGLTDAAKGTLILLYPAGHDRVASIIILGSHNRFEDGRKLIAWLEKVFNNN